jgi:Gpi18-like mannosyltransferase
MATNAETGGGTALRERPHTVEDAAREAGRAGLELPGTARRAWAFLSRDAVRVPLTIFLLSRVYIVLLGALAIWIDKILPPVAALGYYMPELPGLAHYLLQPWRNWDGHWFSLIAQNGYFERPTTAFFPLYPLLLAGVSWFLDGQIELAGVLISNVALLGALALLYQLVQLDFPRPVARRALLYLALFPTAYYLGAVYSESLFLLLTVGALYAARRDAWWIAGALGFFAALTRSQGILLLIPLVLLFLRQQGWRPAGWRANPISLALVPAGLMVYMAYLRRLFDDPLVMLSAQKGWDRYTATPIETLQTGVAAVDGCAVRNWNAGVNFCWADQFFASPTIATVRDFNWRWALSESNFIELVATIFLIAVALIGLRRLPLAYSAYLAAGILLPLWSPSAVHPLMSMHRFTLTLFPVFIVLALLGKWRPVHGAFVAVSALLLAFLTIQFASWLWVA